ncbi:hypothetical protein BVG79_02162 [Ketogulonicigenium robustum]|uniref:Uncharacterized protein n=1 Tax=Ketogulonicigenium robustum TaxID=92947 RepID=A0A1W6P1V8_9RHOB|nr:hypothetical protein BVG79_02162 [Ketogulonicigenium robustum]
MALGATSGGAGALLRSCRMATGLVPYSGTDPVALAAVISTLWASK